MTVDFAGIFVWSKTSHLASKTLLIFQHGHQNHAQRLSTISQLILIVLLQQFLLPYFPPLLTGLSLGLFL